MKLKLDENLGERGREILASAGHDVATVPAQGLQAAGDEQLIGDCLREKRGLVTLDLDFANPFRFQPSRYPGIAVLRLPRKPSKEDLLFAVRTLAAALTRESLAGRLWIIEVGRVRVFQEETEED
ncbi:MAG: DUF5615 family PIN-like protein [Planctomycetes bacterium]|nr:DUF5615 family PIN-like protein [Planctomycetota bacterium]